MSEVKVNKISPRTNCGTVQLGDSGDTITIPSGATINNQGTATNFGATGSASWTTTVKTGDFTAVAGEGYFVDTTSGAISVNLPAGTAGAVVAFKDYLGTFDTNALTLVQNGSDKIGGSTVNTTLETEGIAVTLVFIDSTQGWLVTDSGLQSEAPGAQFITATGGTVTTVCTNFKVHTFTSPGTFCVSSAGNAAGSNTVDYLVVAGGGGGGAHYGAGAGGGGVRMSGGTTTGCYSVGPLGSSPSPVAAAPVTATAFPITVGAGGGFAPGNTPGSNGSNSVFSTFTSTGGGAGAGSSSSAADGNPGGSGGGATGGPPGAAADGGAGNTPPVSPPQGNPGGPNTPVPVGIGASGGGAGAAGVTGDAGGPAVTKGGIGIINNINPASGDPSGGSQYYAAGGNPSQTPNSTPGAAGGGGGGPGGPPTNGAGGTNTGGGGGGNGNGGAGGSGIVIIRYKFQ